MNLVDPRLSEFILVSEIREGQVLAEPIFRYKYGDPAPVDGHHIMALYRDAGGWLPAAYVNYLSHGPAMLSRGACTDGRVLRAMAPEQLATVTAAGGLMLQLMRYGEALFEDESVATFACCGDARSWSVVEQCGYQRLDHPYLIVRWNRQLQGAEQRALLDSIHQREPF